MSKESMIPKSLALEAMSALGVELMSIIPTPEPFSSQGLDTMLTDGVGDMKYMKNHRQLRLDVKKFFPRCASVLVSKLNYSAEIESGKGEIRRARYAQGKDYHTVFRKLLKRGMNTIITSSGRQINFRIAVDSAPVLERTVANHAEVGWLGKNALLLVPNQGSYHFLGFVFSDAKFEYFSSSNEKDRCGHCQRCVSACPTDAIVPGRRVVSTRCISYLTIEHKGVIPRERAAEFQGWWFGCDICQEVCPWNRFALEPSDQRLLGSDPESTMLALKRDEFDEYFAGRAVRRISYDQFKRNLIVALYSLDRLSAAIALARSSNSNLVVEQAMELGLDLPQS